MPGLDCLFGIQPRDQAPGMAEGSQIATTVRVVPTIGYLLRGRALRP
jgi:hypothetical protein